MKTIFNFSLTILLIITTCASCTRGGCSRDRSAPFITKTTLLGTLPYDLKIVDREIDFSPDRQRYVFYGMRDGKWHTVIDGKESSAYDGLDHVGFFDDGKKTVVEAKLGDKEFVEMDQQKGKEYDYINYLTISPDDRRIAYIAGEKGKYFLVVDGEEQADSYNSSGGDIVFSPDGKRIAFQGEMLYYDPPRYKMFAVVDGKKGKEYDWVMKPNFNRGGEQVYYAAEENKKWFVVLNGKEGKKYDQIYNLVLSPDGKNLAYRANRDNKQFIVVNDKEGNEYDDMRAPIFSPDGSRMAYVAKQGGKWFTVIDGQEGEKYDDISSLTFSSDGKKVVYAVMEGDQLILIVNGEEKLRGFDEIHTYHTTFSPKGDAIAYVVSRDKKWYVMIDDKEGKPYDRIWNLTFSPDGKYVGYNARSNADLWWVVEEVPGE